MGQQDCAHAQAISCHNPSLEGHEAGLRWPRWQSRVEVVGEDLPDTFVEPAGDRVIGGGHDAEPDHTSGAFVVSGSDTNEKLSGATAATCTGSVSPNGPSRLILTPEKCCGRAYFGCNLIVETDELADPGTDVGSEHAGLGLAGGPLR